MKGFRETVLFLYRYWTCCFTDDPDRALDDTLSLNSEFRHPLPEREVINATKSAEKAWSMKSDAKANELAKALGYPGAGYNMPNSKIIEWLDISPQEQEHLSSIIGAAEKRRRNTIAKREQRRAQGVIPREQYLAQEAEQKQERMQPIIEAIKQNPGLSQRALAKKTGYSRASIQRAMNAMQ